VKARGLTLLELIVVMVILATVMSGSAVALRARPVGVDSTHVLIERARRSAERLGRAETLILPGGGLATVHPDGRVIEAGRLGDAD
jgi:prepilin-type N-terminal cleavage/methylation domain-containing protein